MENVPARESNPSARPSGAYRHLITMHLATSSHIIDRFSKNREEEEENEQH